MKYSLRLAVPGNQLAVLPSRTSSVSPKRNRENCAMKMMHAMRRQWIAICDCDVDLKNMVPGRVSHRPDVSDPIDLHRESSPQPSPAPESNNEFSCIVGTGCHHCTWHISALEPRVSFPLCISFGSLQRSMESFRKHCAIEPVWSTVDDP